MRLKDKAAIVTGAAGGLGLGIAARFAAEGAAVALIDFDRQRGESVESDLRQQGHRVRFIQADLSEPHDIVRATGLAAEWAGRLDIVVNNAATFLPKKIEDIGVGEWDYLMAINLRAAFLLVQAALPMLRESRGCVLNISSTAAIRVFSPNLPYSVAKAGLITMTQSLAQELHADRIRVNCICPGAVDTPALHRDIAARGVDAGAVQRLRDEGYLTTPEQIASVALHLVSDEAVAITGSVVVADGGAMLA
ncbi:MAG: SDR family oxidoreductase [Chloroflexi bacterium]|nr:SDR family oxidoreductase [Chloroflexota bacterium]